MSMVRIEKGKHLIHKDDAQEKLEIILQGRVNMIIGDEVIPLDTGTIIGIAACEKQRYCCDYIAAEDTVLMEYPYKQVADLEKLFAEQPKYATVFPMAAVKQANTVLNYYGKRTELAKKLYSMGVGMYRDYKYLCSKYDLTEKQLMSMEHLVPLEQSYILEEWKQGYFQALAGKDMQSVNAFLGTDFAVGIGTMLYAGKVINEVLAKMEAVRDYLHYWQDILLEEGSDDLFQLYFDLEIRATRKGADTSDIQQRMEKLMEFIHGSELYDEKFVYMREKIFKLVCNQLLRFFSLDVIKKSLVDAGILYPESSRTFTRKVNYYNLIGEYKRVRMFCIQRTEINRLGEMDFVDLCLDERRRDL